MSVSQNRIPSLGLTYWWLGRTHWLPDTSVQPAISTAKKAESRVPNGWNWILPTADSLNPQWIYTQQNSAISKWSPAKFNKFHDITITMTIIKIESTSYKPSKIHIFTKTPTSFNLPCCSRAWEGSTTVGWCFRIPASKLLFLLAYSHHHSNLTRMYTLRVFLFTPCEILWNRESTQSVHSLL